MSLSAQLWPRASAAAEYGSAKNPTTYTYCKIHQPNTVDMLLRHTCRRTTINFYCFSCRSDMCPLFRLGDSSSRMRFSRRTYSSRVPPHSAMQGVRCQATVEPMDYSGTGGAEYIEMLSMRTGPALSNFVNLGLSSGEHDATVRCDDDDGHHRRRGPRCPPRLGPRVPPPWRPGHGLSLVLCGGEQQGRIRAGLLARGRRTRGRVARASWAGEVEGQLRGRRRGLPPHCLVAREDNRLAHGQQDRGAKPCRGPSVGPAGRQTGCPDAADGG